MKPKIRAVQTALDPKPLWREFSAPCFPGFSFSLSAAASCKVWVPTGGKILWCFLLHPCFPAFLSFWKQLLNMQTCKKLPERGSIRPPEPGKSGTVPGGDNQSKPKQLQKETARMKNQLENTPEDFGPNQSFSKAPMNLETSWWTRVPKGSCLNPWQETKTNQFPSGVFFF